VAVVVGLSALTAPDTGGSFDNLETATMLRVTVLGNLGSDAEQRFSAKGAPIAQFRVAVNQVRTNAGGEREESTEWFRVNVAGRQAEFASRLQKGQRVLVDGRLQISHFQRKDGTAGVGFDVWADEVQNAGGRSAPESEDGRAPVSAATGEPADEPLDYADLPF
jgi:single-strand DNA-binding protein